MSIILGDQGILKRARQSANIMYDAEVNTEVGFNSIITQIDKVVLEKVEGEIFFSNLTWENGLAKVMISTKTEYNIEYQINTIEEKWIRISNNKEINNLKNNDVVNARLCNGEKRGEIKSMEIKDTIAPQVEVELVRKTTNSITIEVKGIDNESGIGGYRFFINEKEVENVEFLANEYTYKELEDGTQYILKVIAKDNAGNESIGKLEEIYTYCATTQCTGPFEETISCANCKGVGTITSKCTSFGWTYCGHNTNKGTRSSCVNCGTRTSTYYFVDFECPVHNVNKSELVCCCNWSCGEAWGRKQVSSGAIKCSGTSTQKCTNCAGTGKVTTSIQCIHKQSDTHWYCEHGNNQPANYHEIEQ